MLHSAQEAMAALQRSLTLDEVVAAYYAELERGRPPDRNAYLERHPHLAERLREFFRDEDFLKAQREGVGLCAERSRGMPSLPRQFGSYELIEEIGRGGMGVVYKARQANLDRTVALKVLLAGEFASASEAARFRDEALSAARLDHRGIVPVYEAAEAEGRSYLTMKLIDGASLAQRLPEYVGRPAAVARLLEAVAAAVHHAHSRGVIHRDLKPANILLDRDGAPHVTDFGLAWRLDRDESLTRTGVLVGTPSYMAPEQAAGSKARELTAAADVYSLGAILYELLTGRPPFRADSSAETLRQVREEEPPRPSRVAGKVPRDLETICLRALEKDPRRRCSSALELAAELARYREGKAIRSSRRLLPGRALDRLRRRPMTAMFGGAALLAAAASIALGLLLSAASRERALASRRQAYLRDTHSARSAIKALRTEDALSLLRRHSPLPGEPELRSFDWYQLWSLLHSHRVALPEARAVVFSPDGKTLAFLPRFDGGVKLLDLESLRERSLPSGKSAEVRFVSFSADGRLLAAVCDSPAVRVWRLEARGIETSWSQIVDLPGAGGDMLAFAPDGKTLWAEAADGRLRIWETEGWRELEIDLASRADIGRLVFSADGGLLLVGSPLLEGGRLWRVGASHGLPVLAPTEVSGRFFDLSADGRLISGVWNGQAGIRSVDDPSESVVSYHVSSVPAFSPDGVLLAGGLGGGTVSLMDLSTGKVVRLLRGHSHFLTAVCFSPDGRWLAAGAGPNGFRVWDLEAPENPQVLDRQEDEILALALSGDGMSLVTLSCSSDYSVRRYDLGLRDASRCRGREVLKVPEDHWVEILSPDGRLTACARNGRRVEIWPLVSGAQCTVLEGFETEVKALGFSLDSRTLATVTEAGEVELWDERAEGSWRERMRFEAPIDGPLNPIRYTAFSPDAKLLALATWHHGRVSLWDLRAGRLLARFECGLEHGLRALAFSPDARLLATGGAQGAARLWSIADPTTVRWTPLEADQGEVHALAFSPDGRLLATGGTQGTIRLWEVESGALRTVLEGHAGGVRALAFSAGGSLLVSGGGVPAKEETKAWGEVLIWRAAKKEEVDTFLQAAR
jgi:serine/threonine protein kinase